MDQPDDNLYPVGVGFSDRPHNREKINIKRVVEGGGPSLPKRSFNTIERLPTMVREWCDYMKSIFQSNIIMIY